MPRTRFAPPFAAAALAVGLVLGTTAPAAAGPGDLPVITSAAPANVVRDVPYSHTFTVTGDAPFVFALDATIAGLSLDPATGELSGTATAFGNTAVMLTVTDVDGDVAQQAYVVRVVAGVGITTVSVPDGAVGAAYSAALAAIGADPLMFALTAGALPPGLTLSGAGSITGTPTAAGAFAFEVTLTDSNGREGSRRFTLVVVNDPDITSGTPANGTAGTPYSHAVTATGTGPLLFAITAGMLPAGLAIDASTGVIAGIPSAAGTYAFTVTVTNASAATMTATYEVVIAAAPLPPTGVDALGVAALAGMLLITGAVAVGGARRARS